MLGVYDHPHDDDIPFLRSTSVGSSWPADIARKLTKAVADADDLLDSIIPIG